MVSHYSTPYPDTQVVSGGIRAREIDDFWRCCLTAVIVLARGQTMKRSEVAEEIFAQEWAIDRNGTRAAIAAGFSEKSAHVFATRLLKKVKVQKLINAHLSRLAVRASVSAERVLRELDILAHSNMDDYVRRTPDGNLQIDFTNVTRDQMAAVQEIKVDTTGGTGDGKREVVLRTTFKLADKGQNLERLGRHLKLFTDVVKHEGLEGLAEKLNVVRSRKNATGD
jgi:phage terminase small subunit